MKVSTESRYLRSSKDVLWVWVYLTQFSRFSWQQAMIRRSSTDKVKTYLKVSFQIQFKHLWMLESLTLSPIKHSLISPSDYFKGMIQSWQLLTKKTSSLNVASVLFSRNFQWMELLWSERPRHKCWENKIQPISKLKTSHLLIPQCRWVEVKLNRWLLFLLGN